jgi:hypothetical protein
MPQRYLARDHLLARDQTSGRIGEKNDPDVGCIRLTVFQCGSHSFFDQGADATRRELPERSHPDSSDEYSFQGASFGVVDPYLAT